mgnify:CR=1 FL=1
MLKSFNNDDVVIEELNGKDLQEKMLQKKTPPSSMLIDVNMPVMNGLETAKWLNAHYPQMKLVALSMNDDDKTIIDMIKAGPAAWRIFLFNIFEHAPQITKDFSYPDYLMKGFVKKYPMLFTGGETSITHLHFDIDVSHILHTQFLGRKRVLLFPNEEQHKLYRKPFEVLSLADFSNYYHNNGKPDYEKFPALKYAKGYEIILEHGDTLFMPAGYWHHMEYLDSGFAMSLRAMQAPVSGKLKGVWNLFGMRSIDTVLKKTVPKWWYGYKMKKIKKSAAAVLKKYEN